MCLADKEQLSISSAAPVVPNPKPFQTHPFTYIKWNY